MWASLISAYGMAITGIALVGLLYFGAAAVASFGELVAAAIFGGLLVACFIVGAVVKWHCFWTCLLLVSPWGFPRFQRWRWKARWVFSRGQADLP